MLRTATPIVTDRWHSLRRYAIVALAFYWLLLFAGTHYPKPPNMGSETADKYLHFGAYAGLGFLLCAWRAATVRPRWLQVLGMIGLLAIYGALDEISQTIVGRDCQLGDWYADVAGAIVGIGLVLAIRPLLVALGGRPM